METKNPAWLSELSFALILPAFLYVIFASSSVWANGNVIWTNFYTYFSSPANVGNFNFFAPIIILGTLVVGFFVDLLSLLSLSNKDVETKNRLFAVDVSLGLLSLGLIVSLFLFYSGFNIFSLLFH